MNKYIYKVLTFGWCEFSIISKNFLTYIKWDYTTTTGINYNIKE